MATETEIAVAIIGGGGGIASFTFIIRYVLNRMEKMEKRVIDCEILDAQINTKLDGIAGTIKEGKEIQTKSTEALQTLVVQVEKLKQHVENSNMLQK